MKYLFYNDYSEGAHPALLEAIGKYNNGQEAGYGEDAVTKKAADSIRKALNMKNVEIAFVSGGTQANIVALSSLLLPYESIIAPVSGHINVHEAGAIEATGHKIEAVPSADGKLTVEAIQKVVTEAMPIHMTKPKVVFISNSTEVGTTYTKHELEALSVCCKENDLFLYMDGARLGAALTATGQDLTLSDIASLVDAFYIGGTKNGAAMGEAIVLCNDKIQKSFGYHLKQHGALLAKGRFIASQFIALFKNNLYTSLARHANDMAMRLDRGIRELGYHFLVDSPTNQLFPILPDSVIKKLQNDYGFYIWSQAGKGESAIRLVTSWATTESAVDEFITTLKTYSI